MSSSCTAARGCRTTNCSWQPVPIRSSRHLPGPIWKGVTSLRTVDDARQILAACRAGAKCVCIGGGLLGLETAGALARQHADVTLLEGFGWLLPRQLNQRAGEILDRYVLGTGIKLRNKALTREIVGGAHGYGLKASAWKTAAWCPPISWSSPPAFGPTATWRGRTGLEVNQGIVVNNLLVTSHPDVFAAGDVAEHRGQVYGIWGPAQYQGSIAGMNMAGGCVEFGGVPAQTR